MRNLWPKRGIQPILSPENQKKREFNDPHIIHVDYTLAKFSGNIRKADNAEAYIFFSLFQKVFCSGEWNEFGESIRETFERLLAGTIYAKTEICVNIIIFQNDGSVKSTVFNAVNLALLDAGINLTDFISSVTIGFWKKNTFLVDLTTREHEICEGELVLVCLPKKQEISFLQFKNGKMPGEKLRKMIGQGVEAAGKLHDLMREQVNEICVKKLISGN